MDGAVATHLFERGTLLMQQGMNDDALRAFRHAAEADPGLPEAWYNMGVIYQRAGRLSEAIDCYHEALVLKNNFAQACFNLAHALDEQGRFEEAAEAYSDTLRLDPANARAAYNLANLFKSRGRVAEAVRYFEQALRIDPDYAAALNNLGVIRRDQDRLAEARELIEKALSIETSMPEALYNLGVCRQKSGEYEAGRECYRQALEVAPDYAPARWLYHLSLPMLYDREEDIATARQRFERELNRLIDHTPLDSPETRRQALSGIASTTNFFLQYQGYDDLALQQRYGRFVCRVMAANYPEFAGPLEKLPQAPGQRLRIGYVSSFMRAHTVGIFLLGWLKSHDRSRFEVSGYSVGSRQDELTDRIAAHLDHFHAPGPDLEAAVRRIAGDRLHVLIHTDVGMDPITLQLAALRLAPVQCKGWGHPVTTGLPTIDYYLSSDAMEPEQAGRYYSETLIRLPGLALNYTPPDLPAAPRTRRDLGLPEKAFIYLSTQSLFKYLPQYDALYPAIAARVPQACFVFIAHGQRQVTRRFRRRLQRAFAAAGLSADAFCRFVPRQDHAGFLSLNLAADVLLDTFAWSGGKTTLEALACGLPVVTCPGRFMRGRHAFAMLNMMEISQTIADDMSQYCAIAVRLAQDRPFYMEMRAAVAERRGRLFEDRDFMKTLEDFLIRQASTESTLRPAPSHRQTQPSDDARRSYEAGTDLLNMGRLDEAIFMLEKAVRLLPASAAARNNLAKALQLSGRLDEALAMLQRALRSDPGYATAHFNMAECLAELMRQEEAITAYGQALDIDPNMGAALNNLGNLHRRRGDFDRAAVCYRRLLQISPDLPEAHYNLGSVMREKNDPGQALVHLTRAVELRPDYAEAWNNLALTLKSIGEFDRALSCFNHALQAAPDLAVAHWNRAFVFLLKDDFLSAWNDFEWRFRIPDWKSIYPFRPAGKRWKGESVPQATILVHDEQGLGDTLQFVRYLPRVKQRCGRVILETRGELMTLLNGLAGIDRLVERPGDSRASCAHDFYVPLMSLPGIFNTTAASIPWERPYIVSDPQRCDQWRDRLPRAPLTVGLVWAGRPEHRNDRNRSCALADLAPLGIFPGIALVSLQKGPAAGQIDQSWAAPGMVDIGHRLNDFSDTAAVLSHLDLLITVDTAVAHLAGAMGRPVWVLVPFIPDWRWGLRRADTPWYPTMRLFRQDKPGMWQPVIERMVNELRRFAGASRSPGRYALPRDQRS